LNRRHQDFQVSSSVARIVCIFNQFVHRRGVARVAV